MAHWLSVKNATFLIEGALMRGFNCALQIRPHPIAYSPRWTHLRGSLDGGSVFEKKFDDFDSILFAGDVKRSEAVQSASIHLRLSGPLEDIVDGIWRRMKKSEEGRQSIVCTFRQYQVVLWVSD